MIRNSFREAFLARSVLGLVLSTLVLALALAAAPSACAAELPPIPEPCPAGDGLLPAQTPEDEILQQRVEQTLAAAPFDRLTEIQVVAVAGTVCLLGTASSPSDRQRAEILVAAVAGVVEVVNRLEIPLAR